MNIDCYGNDDSFGQLHQTLDQPVLDRCKACKAIKYDHTVPDNGRLLHCPCQKLQRFFCRYEFSFLTGKKCPVKLT